MERLVVLEDLLNSGSNLVVLSTNLKNTVLDIFEMNTNLVLQETYDTRVKHTRLGVERVDSRVDTKLGNGTRQHSGGVQVSEGGSGSGIRQIISGHVDGLHGSDGALLRGGDTLLPV